MARLSELQRKLESDAAPPMRSAACGTGTRSTGGEPYPDEGEARGRTCMSSMNDVIAAAFLCVVVEDDDEVRSSIEEVLSAAGHAVTTATTGTEALKVLRLQPNMELIVLDLALPEMDGWEFRLMQKPIQLWPTYP